TVSLIVTSVGACLAFLFWPRLKTSPEELSRVKFDRLVAGNTIVMAQVVPRPFPGIYTISGAYLAGSEGPKTDFTVTTHLTETQLTALLSRPNAAIEVPKSGTRAKFWDILPAILVVLLVAGALAYQVNMGKGKTSHHIQERPRI